MSNRLKSVTSGVISAQLFLVVYLVINITTTPYIVHGLTPEDYGMSVILFQITSYLAQMDFGFGAGVARFLAGTRNKDEDSTVKVNKIVTTSFIVYTFIGLLIAFAGVGLAPFLPRLFFIEGNVNEVVNIIRLMSIVVGGQILLKTISGIFFAHQKQALANTLTFVLSISNLLFIVLFISLGKGLWSFVFAQALSFSINALLNIFFFRKHYKHIQIRFSFFDASLMKEIFSYGFSLFLIGIAVQIVFQTDRIVIGSIISLAAVSVYSLTTKIPELSASVIWKIAENTFPAMVELSKDNEAHKFEEAHSKIMRLTLSISMLAFWCILILCPYFLDIWVGKKYFAGHSFLLLVSYLYLFQHTIINVTSVCLNGAGIVKGLSKFSLLEAAINIGLSLFLGKVFGLEGVIVATIISALITSGWYVPYTAFTKKQFSIKTYFKHIAEPLVFSSLLGMPLYLLVVNGVVNPAIDNWFSLIMYALITVAIISIPLVWANRQMIQYFKHRFVKPQSA